MMNMGKRISRKIFVKNTTFEQHNLPTWLNECKKEYIHFPSGLGTLNKTEYILCHECVKKYEM
jgi:hypothetical protein